MSIEVALKMRVAELEAAINEGAVRGLNQAGARLQAVSVAATPIDEGDLRSGTTVIPAQSVDDRVKVHNDLPYAARQHEELGWSHPRGGQAKYLEQPAFDNADDLFGIVAANIRRSTS